MKVIVIRTRMIMNGCGNSYDVLVPASEVPNYNPTRYINIIRNGETYVDLSDAIIPESHWTMPKGLPRFDDRMEWDKKARTIKLAITQEVYPETTAKESWPTLWICGTDYPSDEREYNFIN